MRIKNQTFLNCRGFVLVLFVLCVQWASSQIYVSDKLQQIAAKTSISVDTSKPKGYYDAGLYAKRTLCAGISSNHKVYHIGYKLFADDMKTQYPTMVYDFLERYLLELDCIASEGLLSQYLNDDGVRVVEGNLENTKYIGMSTEFSFTCVDNVYYDIKWNAGSKTLLRLQFPVNFELLLGMRKSELENYVHDILAEEPTTFSPPSSSPSVELLSNGYFRSSPFLTYQLESLSTVAYYERGDNNDYVPVYDNEQPEYSIRNLLRGLVACNFSLSIKQNLYGYKQKRYVVSLAQWLNYCRSNGLRLYVGISQREGDDDHYKAVIIAQSDALAYNHLMTVVVPKDFISSPNATFDATVNAFIPTHNIKAVYQESARK